jgi:hypothetical protein
MTTCHGEPLASGRGYRAAFRNRFQSFQGRDRSSNQPPPEGTITGNSAAPGRLIRQVASRWQGHRRRPNALRDVRMMGLLIGQPIRVLRSLLMSRKKCKRFHLVPKLTSDAGEVFPRAVWFASCESTSFNLYTKGCRVGAKWHNASLGTRFKRPTPALPGLADGISTSVVLRHPPSWRQARASAHPGALSESCSCRGIVPSSRQPRDVRAGGGEKQVCRGRVTDDR